MTVRFALPMAPRDLVKAAREDRKISMAQAELESVRRGGRIPQETEALVRAHRALTLARSTLTFPVLARLQDHITKLLEPAGEAPLVPLGQSEVAALLLLLDDWSHAERVFLVEILAMQGISQTDWNTLVVPESVRSTDLQKSASARAGVTYAVANAANNISSIAWPILAGLFAPELLYPAIGASLAHGMALTPRVARYLDDLSAPAKQLPGTNALTEEVGSEVGVLSNRLLSGRSLSSDVSTTSGPAAMLMRMGVPSSAARLMLRSVGASSRRTISGALPELSGVERFAAEAKLYKLLRSARGEQRALPAHFERPWLELVTQQLVAWGEAIDAHPDATPAQIRQFGANARGTTLSGPVLDAAARSLVGLRTTLESAQAAPEASLARLCAELSACASTAAHSDYESALADAIVSDPRSSALVGDLSPLSERAEGAAVDPVRVIQSADAVAAAVPGAALTEKDVRALATSAGRIVIDELIETMNGGAPLPARVVIDSVQMQPGGRAQFVGHLASGILGREAASALKGTVSPLGRVELTELRVGERLAQRIAAAAIEQHRSLAGARFVEVRPLSAMSDADGYLVRCRVGAQERVVRIGNLGLPHGATLVGTESLA